MVRRGLALGFATLAVGGCGAGGGNSASSPAVSATPASLTTPTPSTRSSPDARARPARQHPQRARSTRAPAAATIPATVASSGPFAVGERTVTFVDHSRRVRFPGRAPGPRVLQTEVWYPQHPDGRLPLILFGHGYAVTPAPYTPLLRAWARAGFLVAAPIFPLENANAPGGPNESDLVNQPRDMSFVISSVLALGARRSGWLAGAIAGRAIAVSGQSDGGETALAAAYDRHFLDRRIRAAAILSGAEIPGVGGFDFPAPSPPLLATQGTADTINPPHFTYQFFGIAPRPKFLLRMFGAPHLPPYTTEQPQLRIVERVTIGFFQRYLKGWRPALRRMLRAGDRPGISAVQSES